jgi:hypothetical protein
MMILPAEQVDITFAITMLVAERIRVLLSVMVSLVDAPSAVLKEVIVPVILLTVAVVPETVADCCSSPYRYVVPPKVIP